MPGLPARVLVELRLATRLGEVPEFQPANGPMLAGLGESQQPTAETA